MLNFARPKDYALKPTITVKMVPPEITHLEEAYHKLKTLPTDYSLNDAPYIASYSTSDSSLSTPSEVQPTRIYL